MTAKKLREWANWLRHQIKGKTFDQAPEAFKDIESLKVIAARIQGRKK